MNPNPNQQIGPPLGDARAGDAVGVVNEVALDGEVNDSVILDLDSPAVRLSNEVPIRQVRLAISMVGGSALCLYENGVAQELFRLVHGAGLYGVLKRLTQSHAFVDVLSGTSAGGINTILLSAALTSGSDFRITKDTWIELADIDNLMQRARNDKAKAILQGEDFYTPKLEHVFQRLTEPQTLQWTQPVLPSGCAAHVPGQPSPHQYRDLDLFVTGTYYDGRLQTFFDARNQPIYGRDHAGVFHLKHRPRREESHFHIGMGEPLTGRRIPGSNSLHRSVSVPKRLARIARTTSSLPAVFEPSRVSEGLMQGVIPLPSKAEEGVYILDGGFLNNRPLDLVLKEIYFREADAEVLRKVLLVEPDPEPPRRDVPVSQAPNALESLVFWQTVSDYQSLSNFLRSVEEHNQRVQRVNETLSTAREHFRRGSNITTNATQREIWASLSAQSMRDEIIEIWENVLGLKNFGGLQDGDQTQIDASRQHLVEEAKVLRYVRAELLGRINTFFRPTTQVGSALVTTTYDLEDVDITALLRRVMRAQSEIYQTLYPLPTGNDMASTGTAQIQRQNTITILGGPTSPALQAVQRYLGEIAHLADLAHIVSECMGKMLAALVNTPPYNQLRQLLTANTTAKAQVDQSTDQFWELIVKALRLLLEDGELSWQQVKADQASDPTDLEQSYNNEASRLGKVGALQERQAKQALEVALPSWHTPEKFGQLLASLQNTPSVRESFYELSLPTRCEVICGALTETRASSTPPLTLGEVNCGHLQIYVSATPRGNTIQSRINDRLNETIHLAALKLNPLFEPLGPKELPLHWAYNWSRPNVPEVPMVQEVASAEEIGVRLRDLDTYTFPVQRAAVLDSLSTVELVHLTPRGAQANYSNRDPEDKLAGDELGHLSGFLKASWRANDILWGRLDGSVTLVDTLLDAERLHRLVAADPQFVDKLWSALEAYVLRGEVAPPLDQNQGVAPAPQPADEIGRYLQSKFTSAQTSIEGYLRDPAQFPHGFAQLKYFLLQRAQLEILLEDVPEVLAQGLAESAKWRQGQYAERTKEPFALNWKARLTPEEHLTGQASSSIGSDASNAGALLKTMRRWVNWLFQEKPLPVVPALNEGPLPVEAGESVPGVQAVASYFVNQYHVGSETVEKNIPPLVTLRRASALLLIVLNVLEGCFHNDDNALFRLLSRFILKPLRFICILLYGFARALENGQSVQIAVNSSLWVVLLVSVLALAFNYSTNNALVWTALLSSLGLLILFDALQNNRRLAGGYLLLVGVLVMALGTYSAYYFSGGVLTSVPTTETVSTDQLARQTVQAFAPEFLKAALTHSALWWGGLLLIVSGLFLLTTSSWRWKATRATALITLATFAFVTLVSFASFRLFSSLPGYFDQIEVVLSGWMRAQKLLLAIGGVLIAASLLWAYYLNCLSQPLRGPRTPGGLSSFGLAGETDELLPFFYSWGLPERNLARGIIRRDYLCAVGYLGLSGIALFHSNYFATDFCGWFAPPLLFAAVVSLVLIVLDWTENHIMWKTLRLADDLEKSSQLDAQQATFTANIKSLPHSQKTLQRQRLCAKISLWRWALLFVVSSIVFFSVALRGFDAFILSPARSRIEAAKAE